MYAVYICGADNHNLRSTKLS